MYFFFLFLFLYVFLVGSMFVSFFFGNFVFGFVGVALGSTDLSFSFLFDYLSLGFFGAVSFISSMVFLYSLFYMQGCVDSRRFYWLVFGFVLSMGLLVFSGSIFTLMVGWDGLGLISFCLVVFYANYSSLESGLVTVFSNRVGDVFFLSCFFVFFLGESGLSGCFVLGGALVYSFLLLGAITKSAQFPFSAWLPAAMSAPTPVSSLVHSSTLVTAGVYVLLRFHYLFFWFSFSFLKLFFILTMLLAGFCACVEADFKKIVAMSTLSQLGLMLFILSVGVWLLTFMHMVIHAFFKSLLFMTTGSLMHNLGGGQDSRVFGGDSFSFGCFLCFVVSSLCLMGFPFFIGFYSKDLILLGTSLNLSFCFFSGFLVGCFLTIYYSFRLLNGAFLGFCKGVSYASFGDSKVFLGSVFFLFFKSWLLGAMLVPLYFFEMSMGFFGFDLGVGLVLIFFVLLVYGGIRGSYPYWVYLQGVGYLRWFSAAGSSSTISLIKVFRWDTGWLELGGGQGIYWFLQKACNFDFYKALGMGVACIFFFVILITLLLS